MIPYILVVEDEDALAALLQYNLDKEGYRVTIATDGEVRSAERRLGEGENVLHIPTLYAMGARVAAEAAADPRGGAPASPLAVLAYVEMIEQLVGDGTFTPPQALANTAVRVAKRSRCLDQR